MDLDQLTAEVEVVSARQVERNGFTRDSTWLLLKLQEEVGELVAHHDGVDLQAEIEAKWLSRSPDWVRRNPSA